MKSILLIAGHKNIENITALGLRKWRAWSSLRASTGASGEREWIWDILRPLLTDRLIAKGYQVFITDAIYHEETYNRDYDLAIALHFDGGGTDSRCIISKPRSTIVPPFISPEASLLSDQFISAWTSIYPMVTGITSRQDRITEGMTDYYAWDYIKEGTPTVIIEHGNNTCVSDHDKMFNHPDLIADATIEAIIKFLPPDPVVVEESDYSVVFKGQVLYKYERNPQDTINELNKELEGARTSLAQEIQNTSTLSAALTTQEQDNATLLASLRRIETERDNVKVELKEVKGFAKDILGIDECSAEGFRAVSEALQTATASNMVCQTDLKTLKDQSSYEIRWKLGKYFLAKRK